MIKITTLVLLYSQLAVFSMCDSQVNDMDKVDGNGGFVDRRSEFNAVTQRRRVTRSSSPVDIRIRLANGSTPYEGRVEVLYNGEWGTVCSLDDNIFKARVVCRQLGYYGAVEAFENAHFGEGPGPIWIRLMNCYGDESTIAECVHTGWGDAKRCTKKRDFGVRCGDGAVHDVRLADGTGPANGRLEVYYNGQWGTVCRTNATIELAVIVCRQLGFPTVVDIVLDGRYGEGTGPIWLEPVCDSRNHSVSDCIHEGWGNHDCDHSMDVGVICEEDLPLRLVNGRRRSEGRIEVLHNGEWGTVCNWWNEKPMGDVVCRQLGFPGAERVVNYAYFGRGEGEVWLKPRCVGNETSLLHCPHWGWGRGCDHSNDAGVICIDGSIHHEAAKAASCKSSKLGMRLLMGVIILATIMYLVVLVICTLHFRRKMKRNKNKFEGSTAMYSVNRPPCEPTTDEKEKKDIEVDEPEVESSQHEESSGYAVIVDSDVVGLIGEDM